MLISSEMSEQLSDATHRTLDASDERVEATAKVFRLYSQDRWRLMLSRAVQILCFTAIIVSLIWRVKC